MTDTETDIICTAKDTATAEDTAAGAVKDADTATGTAKDIPILKDTDTDIHLQIQRQLQIQNCTAFWVVTRERRFALASLHRFDSFRF